MANLTLEYVPIVVDIFYNNQYNCRKYCYNNIGALFNNYLRISVVGSIN